MAASTDQLIMIICAYPTLMHAQAWWPLCIFIEHPAAWLIPHDCLQICHMVESVHWSASHSFSPQSNACPVGLSAQSEAFRALMGAEPQSAPQRPADSGVSTSCSDDAYLNADITVDELSQSIKRLKRGKSPGIDGILADMIKDGGDLVQQCLLWLVNCMLASHFPERLSAKLITAVYKSGEKFDMGYYRGITVGSVVAKLFAMILEQRNASWAEEHAVKGAGRLQERLSHDRQHIHSEVTD